VSWPASPLAFGQPCAVVDPGGHFLIVMLALARRWSERLTGLIGRPLPERGRGLLIEPCAAVHTLGLSQPIDLVFLDASGRAVRMRKALPTARFAFCPGARSVVELRCGEIDRLGLASGDRWIRLADPGKRLHST
jgi:uncharacterized protein